MMARRKIVILVAGLAALALALGVGLGGCKDLTFNGDMKGYLEYWTGTVTVGGFTWEAENDQRQKNKFGVWTIPTNATVSIKATIENPDNYPLDYGVGTAADTLRSVRTAGPVGGTVRVTGSSPTSIELELVPFSSVPTPESRALEHKDFTLTVAPTRTDSGLQAANPQVLTLRYNTPPRMPVEVVEEGGNLKLLGSAKWQKVQTSTTTGLNGKIYWAWPKGITDTTDPDYAARFRVYQKDSQGNVLKKEDKEASKFLLSTVVPNLPSAVTNAVLVAGYDIYAATVDSGNEITIEAVDGEEVASQGTVSGRSPIQITLSANGGAFKNGSNTAVVYKAQGAMVSGGDFETPQLAGSVLTGWSDSSGPITFPHPVPSSPLTLYAQWRSDWSGYISSLGPGPHTVEIDTTLTESDVYALRAAIAASPDAKITLDLSKATLPNNRLPESAFNGEYTSQGKLSNLVGVTLPDNLAGVGDYAFQNTGLTSVTIPGSMTVIAGSAFLGCDQLTSVTIEHGVQTIWGNVFYGCSALTSVTIGNGVETIDYAAFAYTGLTSVDIPGSVKTIGEDAFYGCAQLKNVTIADGVQTIGGEAFIHCTSLTSVDIPGSVQTIGQDAFQRSGLTSVTIPSSVKTWGWDVFHSCTQLTTVILEHGLQSIGRGAFIHCTSLTSVDIPGSVTSIGQGAFQNSGLTDVTIPSSVKTIGHDAFLNSNKLTTVNYRGSQSDWNNISIGSGNDTLNNAPTRNFDYVGP